MGYDAWIASKDHSAYSETVRACMKDPEQIFSGVMKGLTLQDLDGVDAAVVARVLRKVISSIDRGDYSGRDAISYRNFLDELAKSCELYPDAEFNVD